MITDAVIEGENRYALGRAWDFDKPRVVFVMLNPSTAAAALEGK